MRRLRSFGELADLCRELADDVVPAAEAAIERSAAIVRDRAKSLAPEDKGELASEIEAEASGLSATIGTTGVEHAGPQEFGTSEHDAQPFLRPALDNSQRAIEAEFARTLKKELR